MEKVGLKAIFDTADFQRGIQIYNSGIVQINNTTQKAAKQSQTASQTMSAGWSASFGKIAAGIAATVAAFKALEASTKVLQESAMLAARVEMLGIALGVVGKNAGYSREQIDEYEKAVEAQGITTQAARQALLQMGASEIDFAHSTDLARIAQDAARIANTNSSDAFQKMIYGIQSGQTDVLKTMGINVQFENSYKKLAAQLGKITEELTEQEKVGARTQEVMSFGAKIAGTYEASLGTAGGTALSLSRHLEQLQLSLGNVLLGSFAEGVGEVTQVLKDLREWVDDNQEGLGILGESLTDATKAILSLVGEMAKIEDLDLENISQFVDNMVTLVQFLKVGREEMAGLTENVGKFVDVIKLLQPGLLIGEGIKKGIGGWLTDMTKLRKEGEQWEQDAFKTQADLAKEQEKAARAFEEAEKRRFMGYGAGPEPGAPPEVISPPDYTKAAEAISEGLDKIRKLNEDYYRDLARMEADYNKDRAKDEQKYLESVEKEREKQAKQFDKATAAYEKQRAKTIADFQKQVTEAESGGNKERIKAAVDFARQERQERERYQLDRIQGERRYQFEKAKAIAEGDTLAIEELNARYELEKQESAENEDLRSRQAKESQTTQITEAGEAAREQLNELKQQLDEQLAEQDEAYREQITDQQAANAERMMDMAEAYQEQTAAREEQYAEQKARRDEDHQRQLEDLGEALANQEELQKYGADQVANVLQQYYGEGGVADSIMQGWHEREAERVILTSEMLAAMSAVTGEGPEQAMAQAAARRAALATHGRGVSMDTGGIVQGPATVKIGSGIVESFTPLGRVGGNLAVSWSGGPIPIAGLEGASPANVDTVARAMAESLVSKVRAMRRN